MNKTILVVDDELRMRKLLADFLSREGYRILEAANGKAALDRLEAEAADLIILDIMMPEYDGWTVCREIRRTSDIPIIMLTAKGEEVDQLLGFELGVDEYVTKPFSPRILTARVNALFRRMGTDKTACAGLKIDPSARSASLDNERLDLTPKEYELLLYLTENQGRALSREQILNRIWNYDYLGDLRTVDTHITRLRTKLGTHASAIQTIRGFGYRFEAKR